MPRGEVERPICNGFARKFVSNARAPVWKCWYIDSGDLQRLRGYAELGNTVQVPASALGPCAILQMDDIPRFDLGFDREPLLTQHIISGVRVGSAAFQAGLRDGQEVTRTSVYWD